jgi:threonine dehydrogenase-like Zn-dependent dehydrogenase
MKAVILEEIGKYAVVDKPIPEIEKDDDMLVRIECSSICGSDVHILADPPSIPAKIGTTIGHEMVCCVEKVGPAVTDFKPGDRFVFDPNIPCGKCEYCKRGIPNMCSNMYTLGVDKDGAFAEYTIVPERVAVKIPQDMPAEKAIFAEPLNCVISAVNKARLLPGETVLVLGAGPIGQYFIKLFKANGAGRVIASEMSGYRSGFAKESGADVIINPQEENLVERVLEETGGLGADVVVDAVGVLVADAVECVRCGGRILLFGNNQKTTEAINQSKITLKEITVLGSYIGRFTIPATVDLLKSGLADFEYLITHRIKISDFKIGIEAMRCGQAMEVVIYPD